MTTLQVANVAPRAGRAPAVPAQAGYDVPVTSPVPWSPSALTRLFVCNLLGAFGILAAWLGAGGTDDLSAQFNYSSLGVLAFLVAGFGNGVWLLTGRRAVGTRLARLLDSDPRTRPRAPELVHVEEAAPARPVGVRYDAGALVSVPGALRYHLDHCALVRGKQLEQDDLDGHEAAGRFACELCRPAQEEADA